MGHLVGGLSGAAVGLTLRSAEYHRELNGDVSGSSGGNGNNNKSSSSRGGLLHGLLGLEQQAKASSSETTTTKTKNKNEKKQL